MEIAAVQGSYASVIGGAPAAAVVFAGEVNRRTAADPGSPMSRPAWSRPWSRARRRTLPVAGRAGRGARGGPLGKLGEVADEFDTKHSIERAQRVGSVDTIVPASQLRPYLVDAVRRGMARALARTPAKEAEFLSESHPVA